MVLGDHCVALVVLLQAAKAPCNAVHFDVHVMGDYTCRTGAVNVYICICLFADSTRLLRPQMKIHESHILWALFVLALSLS